ncbi:hypothetical protein BDB00DRAFT_520444 [Zychaea mexicana]|uniref:uncharacterized protein n=1 Tax=Zychaea mexicana TaxID=64656 RepID=UPI0022FEA99E|nr:uncharacterized protein BDB00DRAFT_520444 [Zychaea mexicana]KAI9490934.1 hypothetical protein BDB00DRAFT_520444 [Zychaea mexicana]
MMTVQSMGVRSVTVGGVSAVTMTVSGGGDCRGRRTSAEAVMRWLHGRVAAATIMTRSARIRAKKKEMGAAAEVRMTAEGGDGERNGSGGWIVRRLVTGEGVEATVLRVVGGVGTEAGVVVVTAMLVVVVVNGAGGRLNGRDFKILFYSVFVFFLHVLFGYGDSGNNTNTARGILSNASAACSSSLPEQVTAGPKPGDEWRRGREEEA